MTRSAAPTCSTRLTPPGAATWSGRTRHSPTARCTRGMIRRSCACPWRRGRSDRPLPPLGPTAVGPKRAAPAVAVRDADEHDTLHGRAPSFSAPDEGHNPAARFQDPVIGKDEEAVALPFDRLVPTRAKQPKR